MTPGPNSTTGMQFLNRSMSYERDEIKLKNKLQYEQAYFYKGKALKDQNISDVIWEQNSIPAILEHASFHRNVS